MKKKKTRKEKAQLLKNLLSIAIFLNSLQTRETTFGLYNINQTFISFRLVPNSFNYDMLAINSIHKRCNMFERLMPLN